MWRDGPSTPPRSTSSRRRGGDVRARKADLACAGAVDDKIWTAAKKQLDATLAKASAELAVHRAKAKS